MIFAAQCNRGMAVVAGVWGFWDIIAGLLLAAWWARRPLQEQA